VFPTLDSYPSIWDQIEDEAVSVCEERKRLSANEIDSLFSTGQVLLAYCKKLDYVV
jgi:hypothetical protein